MDTDTVEYGHSRTTFSFLDEKQHIALKLERYIHDWMHELSTKGAIAMGK